MDLFAKRNAAIDTENAFKLGRFIAEIEAKNNKVIRLNLGEPDFNVPEIVKTEIKKQIDQNNTHYCDPKGLNTLRTAITKQIYDTRKIQYSPEQVVIFPGAKPSIGFSQQVYCDPGDEIIYPSPGFPIYESFIKYLGAVPKPLHLKETHGFTFTKEDLAPLLSKKTKLIFLNFPSNPTGGVATESELTEIAELILSMNNPNLRVYSDEIYENIVFDGKKHFSIASIKGMEKITIISSGFSKTFAWTGGRIGYAVFPTIEEADVFKNLNINYFSCVPPYNQEAAVVALMHPEAKSAVKQMLQIFEERRNIMMNLLQKAGISCQTPSGAFYVFPNIEKQCRTLGVFECFEKLPKELKEKTSPSTLFQMFALHQHHVAVLDRRSFGKIGCQDEHYIRLSFAADASILEEGIKRIHNAFEDKQGFKAFIDQGKHLF